LEITRLAAEARNIAIRKEELFILRLGFPTCHMAHAMKLLSHKSEMASGQHLESTDRGLCEGRSDQFIAYLWSPDLDCFRCWGHSVSS
jgi:hypothetical protein